LRTVFSIFPGAYFVQGSDAEYLAGFFSRRDNQLKVKVFLENSRFFAANCGAGVIRPNFDVFIYHLIKGKNIRIVCQ